MGTKVNIVVKISTVLNKTSTLSRPTCFLQRSLKRNRKTAKNFHIPLTKTLIDPLQSVTSGAYISFAAIRDRWRRKIAAQIDEKPEPKEQKPKTTSGTKPENPLVFFTTTENRRLKT